MSEPKVSEAEIVGMEVVVKIVFTDPIQAHNTGEVLEHITQALQREIANCGLTPDDEESSVESVSLEYSGSKTLVWSCSSSTENIEDANEKSFSIPAEAYSDDCLVKIKFDAVDYIKNADVEALQALINCGWGGDYPGDYVAKYYEDGVLKPLFDYLDSIKDIHSKKDQRGFECYVDGYQAQKWLAANRLEVFNKLSPF
jgi:hypothetical protein